MKPVLNKFNKFAGSVMKLKMVSLRKGICLNKPY